MTDFYMMLTGRPSPGRQSRRAFLRYANDRESEPGANAPAQNGIVEGRGRPGVDSPMPPEWARVEPGRRNSNVPMSAATGEDTRPFGDDFATWHETTRARPAPSYLRADDAVPQEEIPDPGHAPRNPGNVIADAPEPVGRGFDPDSEWAAAVERSRERWRAGRPSQVDTFIALIFGKEGPGRDLADRVADDMNAGPLTRIQRENDDMQDEIRGNRPRR